MKKFSLLFLTTSLLLFSCTSLDHISGYEKLTGIDFRPYADKGFLITPHEYYGEYTSVFMINYILMPEANYVPSRYNQDRQKVEGTDKWVFTYEGATVGSAVENIYNKCVEMGADAIMDFHLSTNSDNYSTITNPVTVTGIQITGVAIKRTPR